MTGLNQQVIDLEGLANHKGSAFGALGKNGQPTTEQFENFLFEKLMTLNLFNTIWVEDESRSIGSVIIPDTFFNQMKKGIVIKINLDRHIRVQRLLSEYTSFDKQLLLESVNKIEKRLGGKDTKDTRECIENNDFEKAIEITLAYYDKAYNHNLQKRLLGNKLITLDLAYDDPLHNANLIISKMANQEKYE